SLRSLPGGPEGTFRRANSLSLNAFRHSGLRTQDVGLCLRRDYISSPMPIRVLVTDEVDRDGVALLTSESALAVAQVPTLAPDVLLERIADYDAIVGRSATRISEALLRKAKRLRVVGRAGVGVDNIALDVATELGVAVINAPSGNTIAVAELFYGTIISLL